MKRIILSPMFILSLLGSLFFNSCSQKNNQELLDTDYYELSLSTTEPQNIPDFSTQLWHSTNKKILVFFGYNFNSPEITDRLLSVLEEHYGLAEDGGLILPVFYPDNFKHLRSFYSELANIIQDDNYDFSGIITLGAPENTYIALARNQDFWEQNVPYPVFALFPQDNVLGLEATCDIVLDKAQNAQLNGDIVSEEAEVSVIKEAPEILIRAIDYMLFLDSSLLKNKNLSTHLKQILGDSIPFHHYLDSETGLQSINHFVLN